MQWVNSLFQHFLLKKNERPILTSCLHFLLSLFFFKRLSNIHDYVSLKLCNSGWFEPTRWDWNPAFSRVNTLTTSLGFPGGSAGKESSCNARDLGFIPGLGRSSGEGNGYPLQYSGLENSMDCIAHGVTKSQTRLSNYHFKSLLGPLRWLSSKESACNAGDTARATGLIPESGRSPGGGNGNPLQ